jgi:uncharacterized membrane-anchored protein YitT (DUF2179 family)
MNKNKKILKKIEEYSGVVLGAMIFAISYSWFLIPYKIAPGGVGGIGQILYHLFGLPVGMFMIMANIPLFILATIYLGKSFGVNTFLGMIVTSLMTDFLSLQSLHKMGIITDLTKYTHIVDGHTIYAFLGPNDIYLSAISGSVLLGMGLGIIFRSRASTGGTDIPVALIKQKTGLSIGTGYWIVESLIIFSVGIAFKDPKLIIFGYINLFITSKITDLTSEGLPYVKGVFIMSDSSSEIKQAIMDEIGRGVTVFKGEGGYSGKPQNIIFCVLNRRQVPQLIDIVKDIDKSAFVTLTDVFDVMGHGFKTRQLNLSHKKKEKKIS